MAEALVSSPEALEQQSPPEAPSQQAGQGTGVIKALSKSGSKTFKNNQPDAVGPDDGALGIRGQPRPNKRASLLSLKAEEAMQQDHPEAFDKLTNSAFGQALQVLLVVATIFAYVGNPILTTWAKSVEGVLDENGKELEKPFSAQTYMEVFIIWMMKLAMTTIGISYAAYLDYTAAPGEEAGNVRQIFNMGDLRRWIWVALGWSVPDVAEQMAGGNIDPTLYTVLSQSRLVGTAICMRLFFGTKRPNLQWIILVNLSMVITGFKLIGSGNGKEITQTSIGLIATATKMFFSVTCGVAAQGILQGNNVERSYIVVISQMTFLSLLWMSILLPAYIFYFAPNIIGEPWEDTAGNFAGFFGGLPYCTNNKGKIEGCAAENIVSITSWSWKVWVVLAFNVYRDYTVNYILKIFDALVKNLCNASATVVTYFIAITWLATEEFNLMKGIFSLVICFEIAQYSLAQDMPRPWEEDEKTV